MLDYPGGPSLSGLFTGRCNGRRGKDSKCEKDSALLPLKMQSTKECGHPTEAANGPQLMARKETEISVLQVRH